MPCVFTLDAMGMGMLDPTTSEEDLAQGAKVKRQAAIPASTLHSVSLL